MVTYTNTFLVHQSIVMASHSSSTQYSRPHNNYLLQNRTNNINYRYQQNNMSQYILAMKCNSLSYMQNIQYLTGGLQYSKKI